MGPVKSCRVSMAAKPSQGLGEANKVRKGLEVSRAFWVCVEAMHLYGLTLAKPSGVHLAVFGSFSAPKVQEIVVARGPYLELLRQPDVGEPLIPVASTNVFACIRSLKPFRLTGATTDYLVVGSDSGKIVVLQWSVEGNHFERVHEEVFGKTGCRRLVPGQYLAVDPNGRAITIGAVEKQKLVYVMNRDASSALTISSPLEAHKAHTLVFDMVGVDVGFENPVFACLELDYGEADEDPSGEAVDETPKVLTYYELDLGLNHVTRRWSDPVNRDANALVAVPGGSDGPGGVLVLAENWVIYKHQDHPEVQTPIPRREDMPPERGLLVVAHATHKLKAVFFVLIQTEMGDLYKVTLDFAKGKVTDVIVKYFDTIPVANALCITKSGLLFAASEFGNHGVYQFLGMGDTGCESHAVDPEVEVTVPEFTPGALTNLSLTEAMPSLSPIVDMHVADLATEGSPQIYTLCGRGIRSTLRVLRHGLTVESSADSKLAGIPNAVWTINHTHGDTEAGPRYIVVSFMNATLVLGVGETVEEDKTSGLLNDVPTLAVSLMEDNTIVQVHTLGVRHILESGGERKIKEWKPPGSKTILKASCNARQCAVALNGGQIVYFELDATNALVECELRDVGSEVVCMDLADVPAGQLRSPFLAVGDVSRVFLLSLDPERRLEEMAMQAMRDGDVPQSVKLMEMAIHGEAMGLYLNIGTAHGLLQRSAVDRKTGNLTDSRTRFLGGLPVKLHQVVVHGSQTLLSLSSRPWLSYRHQNTFFTTPLSYERIDSACTFQTGDGMEGFVAIVGDSLRILSVSNLGDLFDEQVFPLRYTPRRMAVHPSTGHTIIIETDHNAFNHAERAGIDSTGATEAKDDDEDGMELEGGAAAGAGGGDEDDDDEEESPEEAKRRIGPRIPGEPGKWASCIRVFNPKTGESEHILELEDNEAAFSVAPVTFHDKGGEVHIVVGTVKDLTLHPRAHSGGFIHVYRLMDAAGKAKLMLLHKTEVHDVPYALCEFSTYGRLLAGVGNVLRLYDLGKKKLLRKCETKGFPTFVQSVKCMGDRVYVGDAAESMHFVKYKRTDNALVTFADDLAARHLTATAIVDYSTLAVGDKFGNIAVVRLPKDVSDDVDNPTGNRILWDTGFLNGAPHKLGSVAHFHVGDIVTSIAKSALPGGKECLVYSTLSGAIGALLPFESREDVDFFTHLEMYLRSENLSLVGRDHLSFRSAFIPVKEVVDGDLCEMFASLPAAKQRTMAADLDRSVSEVVKKLEDTRTLVM